MALAIERRRKHDRAEIRECFDVDIEIAIARDERRRVVADDLANLRLGQSLALNLAGPDQAPDDLGRMLQRRLREEENADFHDREQQEKEDRREQGELDNRRAGTPVPAQTLRHPVQATVQIRFDHDAMFQPLPRLSGTAECAPGEAEAGGVLKERLTTAFGMNHR
jgi:hypothetical protein